MDAKTIAELNEGDKCPADAGPAWRTACEMGLDMSLIESNLEMSPWDRLLQNDRALGLLRLVQQSNPALNGESR
jgi:hypothetical protein